MTSYTEALAASNRIDGITHGVLRRVWSRIIHQSRPGPEIDRIFYEKITHEIRHGIVLRILDRLNHFH
jgi:hypothetical protein